MKIISLVILLLQIMSALTWAQPQPRLIAHWKLDGNCADSAGSNDGINKNVTFVEDVDGRKNGAAFFSGHDCFIEVPDSETFKFAANTFSISLWVKVKDTAAVFGDLIQKYDPVARRGLNVYIAGSSPGYDSTSDVRNVHFGIDNGIVSDWSDCGKPSPTVPLITTMVVYKNNLYAGIAAAEPPDQAGRVFRYTGDKKWIDCGRLGNDDLTPSIQSMIVHQGMLYAATGTWDWQKGSKGMFGPVGVYRYEGGKNWQCCGHVGQGSRLLSLASYNGKLYVTDDRDKIFCYEDNKWVCCGVPKDERQVNALGVFNGHLYGGTQGSIYRYDGDSRWICVGKQPFGITQVHKIQVHQGNMYIGTWPWGQVLRYQGPDNWIDCGSIGIGRDYGTDEVMELITYNGKLYGGVIPQAEVYRYEGAQNWTLMKRLVTRADWTRENWRKVMYARSRVPCMTIYQGKLFAGTGNCFARCEPNLPYELGRIYCMEAGRNVSLDDDLGYTWKHLALVRADDCLRLYVDGDLKQSSPAFNRTDDYNISNDQPLLIGFGSLNYFNGALDDIRIYQGVLTTQKVQILFNAIPKSDSHLNPAKKL